MSNSAQWLHRINQNKSNHMLENASILITGGTGSFGHAFVPMTLKNLTPALVILSTMRSNSGRWLFLTVTRVRFIGDVRDKIGSTVMSNIDYVVHAAATKIVLIAEYNLWCVKTNIDGAMNHIDACIVRILNVSCINR